MERGDYERGFDDKAAGANNSSDHDHEDVDFEFHDHNYSDEEFDDDIIETEAFIKYTAPIGPNIVISKSTTPVKKQQQEQRRRYIKRQTTKKITTSTNNPSANGISNINAHELHQVDSTISTSTLSVQLEQTVHTSATCQLHHKDPNHSSLSNEFHKLNLESAANGTTFSKRKKNGHCVRLQKSTSSSLVPTSLNLNGFKHSSRLQERLNSAKRLQISDLKNKVHVLECRMQDLSTENRTLKTLHLRQESALKKYEGKDADLPKMIQHHQNEVTTLQHCLRKAHGHARQYEDKLRSLNHKIYALQSQNEKLNALVKKHNLEERNYLEEKLNESNKKLAETEHKLAEYTRRFELIEKNHSHQLHVESGKLRLASKRLFDAEKEIDRLVDLVKQKDKLLNYLRIRTIRDSNFEPPGIRKILEDDPQVSTYRRVYPTAEMIEQKRLEDETLKQNTEPSPATPERTESRNKSIVSINKIYDRILSSKENEEDEEVPVEETKRQALKLVPLGLPEDDQFVKNLIRSRAKLDEDLDLNGIEQEEEQELVYEPCGSQIANVDIDSSDYDNVSEICNSSGPISGTRSSLASPNDELKYGRPNVSKLRSLYLDSLKQENEPALYRPRVRKSAPTLLNVPSGKDKVPLSGVGDIPLEGQMMVDDNNMAWAKGNKSVEGHPAHGSSSSLEGAGDSVNY